MIATWAPVVFWVLLVPLLIVMLIVYLRSKRFFRLVYIISVFTYAMMIMYWIDSYKLGRNAIIGLLVLSSLLMIFLGYLMHIDASKKLKRQNAKISITCIVLIAIIITLSAMPIGWQITTSQVSSVSLQDIMPILEEGKPHYATPGTNIYSITITNTFLPRQYELPIANACLYNTEKNAYQWTNVNWDVTGLPSDFGPNLNTIELGRETKTANLRITSNPQYRPMPAEPKTAIFEPQEYDKLYLFIDTEYVDCYNIQPRDAQKAIIIEII